MWLAALGALAATVAASALDYGMTREQVLHELGRPTSDMAVGNRLILTYPQNVRIELVDGKVAVVKGLAVVDGAFRPPGYVSPAAKAQAVAVAQVAAKKEEDAFRQEITGGQAKPGAELEKTIGQIEEMSRPAVPAAAKGFDGPAFLLEAILKALMVLLALLAAARFWNCGLLFGGVVLAVSADALTRTAVDFAGTQWLGLPTLFGADEAIAGLALLLVLKQVAINRSTPVVARVVLATKTFTLVIGSFVVTVLLRLIH
jgi:hypothetical protein